MTKKNEPISYDKSLPVKVVGKTREDSGPLREATEKIASQNYDTGTILKILKAGTLTPSRVNNLVKFFPDRWRHPVRTAIAKFKVDKKRDEKKAAAEKKRKKEEAPLRNVRKGGEFAHGGSVGYSQRWKTGRKG